MANHDDDGSQRAERQRARQERIEQQREAREVERHVREHENFLGLRERGEKPDIYGIRLNDRRPSLAEQYGISLIDREQKDRWDQLKADVDAMAERAAAMAERHSHRDGAGRRPAGDGISFSAGSAVGIGPTVSLDGKNDVTFNLPLGRFWPTLPDLGLGQTTGPDGNKEWVVSGEYGKEAPYGLAGVAVGVKVNLDRPEGSSLYMQGRALGLAATLEADKADAEETWQSFIQMGAEWTRQGLNQVGYPPRY